MPANTTTAAAPTATTAARGRRAPESPAATTAAATTSAARYRLASASSDGTATRQAIARPDRYRERGDRSRHVERHTRVAFDRDHQRADTEEHELEGEPRDGGMPATQRGPATGRHHKRCGDGKRSGDEQRG